MGNQGNGAHQIACIGRDCNGASLQSLIVSWSRLPHYIVLIQEFGFQRNNEGLIGQVTVVLYSGLCAFALFVKLRCIIADFKLKNNIFKF